MSEKLDELMQAIGELTRVVKEHKEDSATIDVEALKKEFAAQTEELIAQRVQEKLDSQPVRRAGPAIEPSAVEKTPKANRYAKMVRDFERDGQHKSGLQVYKPVDLWLASKMIEAQARHQKSQGNNWFEASDDLQAAVKAMTSTGSATGDELVPTNMAAALWEDFFLASRVVPTMQAINPTSNPYDIPLGLGDVTWYKGTENTATTASDTATAKSTMTATELLTEQNWSYTLQEDAIIDYASALRRRLAISGAEKMDAFALNADSTDENTGNINLDDANPTDTNYYLSAGQDGIRHQWLVDYTTMTTDAGGDALGDGDLLAALVKMGKYAVNPDDLVIVCDTSTYLKGFLNLDAVTTVDKFGPSAVVLTGQLASYRGIPIIVSASHPLGESDGKVSTTAGNNTLGSLSIFNRNMWYVGFWRDLLIEMDRDIQKRSYLMVTSFRQGVAAHGTRSAAVHTSGVINVLVS